MKLPIGNVERWVFATTHNFFSCPLFSPFTLMTILYCWWWFQWVGGFAAERSGIGRVWDSNREKKWTAAASVVEVANLSYRAASTKWHKSSNNHANLWHDENARAEHEEYERGKKVSWKSFNWLSSVVRWRMQHLWRRINDTLRISRRRCKDVSKASEIKRVKVEFWSIPLAFDIGNSRKMRLENFLDISDLSHNTQRAVYHEVHFSQSLNNFLISLNAILCWLTSFCCVLCFYSQTHSERAPEDEWLDILPHPVFSPDGDSFMLLAAIQESNTEHFSHIKHVTITQQRISVISHGRYEVSHDCVSQRKQVNPQNSRISRSLDVSFLIVSYSR